MTLIAVGTFVVFKKTEKAQEIVKGVYIPDSAKEKTNTGIVESIGCGVDRKKIGIEIGQKILYHTYAAKPFKDEDEEFFVIDSIEIVAVVE